MQQESLQAWQKKMSECLRMVCRTRLYFRGGTALAVSVPSKYKRTNSYIALKERALPFSKIPLILVYVPQDATVLSGELHSKAASEFTAFFAFMQIKSKKLYLIRIRAA